MKISRFIIGLIIWMLLISISEYYFVNIKLLDEISLIVGVLIGYISGTIMGVINGSVKLTERFE